MDGYSPVQPFDVRGLAQGMALFYVEMRIHYTVKGYEGTLTFPTMYTVGGNEEDAIANVVAITRPQSVDGVTGYTVHVVNADPDSEYKMVTARYPGTD